MRLHSLKELDSSEGTFKLHDVHAEDGAVILHPKPNPNDVNDPLRWPKWKKYTCFTSVCVFTFLTNYGIGGLAPAFYPLSIQFNKTQTETSALLLWPILVLGLANFFWVPMSNYFGKRPVFVVATLLLCVSYLWGALAQSFASLVWSNIVAAFAGSASEAVAAGLVNDLFYTHERANLMGWYMNAIAGGNTIGPLICGFVITGSTWRTHKWVAFGLVAANLIAVLLFCPETRYSRSYQDEQQHGAALQDARSTSSGGSEKEGAAAGESKLVPSPVQKVIDADLESRQSSTLRNSPPKRTFMQELRLFSGTPSDISLTKLFLRPLPMIVYPAVVLAFLGFAISLAWVVAINILNSFVLQAPPYSWSPSVNGLINIPALIGNLFGAWAGGWLVDWYSDRQSRRNGGIFQPETRLHLLFIPAIMVFAGLLAFGYGVQEHLHWTALFFGNGLVSVGLTAVPTATMTYVSDVYLPVNADALTLVVGLKNVVCFGFLYAIVPWVDEVGYEAAFGTMAGVYIAVCALAIPVALYGQRIRHITAEWRIIL